LAPSRQQEGGDDNNCEHGGEEDPFHSSTSSARSRIDWGMLSSNHVLEKSSLALSTGNQYFHEPGAWILA